MNTTDLLKQYSDEGKDADEIIELLREKVASAAFTPEQTLTAVTTATTDALVAVGSMIGHLYSIVGANVSPQEAAHRVASQFHLGLAAQLHSIAYDDEVEGEIVDFDGEEE